MLDYGLDTSRLDSGLALPGLVAEGDELDALVSAQDDWSLPTPAAGWTIAHQIAHLAAADANVLVALRTPDAFDAGGRDADLVAAEGAARPRSASAFGSPTAGPWPGPASRRSARTRGRGLRSLASSSDHR
ncbi:maleylpyruvate isomerase N-terminal domain-containing protein [Streptomyces sp. NBC_00631]|uniref:maleylpyruvate isomerase N-terminal domain-containing protein n=1 Tax=Streptomyces sp. NBC_00631 TaxID=2975793 RepID=UPI00386C3B97